MCIYFRSHCNTRFLRPTRVCSQTVFWSVQPLLQGLRTQRDTQGLLLHATVWVDCKKNVKWWLCHLCRTAGKHGVIPYGMCVPAAAKRVANCYIPFMFFYIYTQQFALFCLLRPEFRCCGQQRAETNTDSDWWTWQMTCDGAKPDTWRVTPEPLLHRCDRQLITDRDEIERRRMQSQMKKVEEKI